MQVTTHTLRLTAATAVALVLMTGAAQARPLAINTGHAESSQSGVVYSGTYRPATSAATVSPANNVALAKGAAAARVTLAPDRVDRIGTGPRITPQGNVPDRVDQVGTAQQHQALAPLARAGTIVVHTTSTKGGFDVVGVLALPQEFVTDTLRALPTSKRPWGQTVALVQTPLVNGMIFVVHDTAFIIGGPVSVKALDRVAADIVKQGIS